MMLNPFIPRGKSFMRKNLIKIGEKGFIVRKSLALCLFLFFFNNLCSSLFAQEYSTTIDWLNFVDVSSYLHGSKRSIDATYYVKERSHKDTYTVGDYIESSSNDLVTQVIYLISGFNWDWRLSEKFTLGILPIYAWGASPGGISQDDLITWLKLKYFPLKKKKFYSRLALKIPVCESEVRKKQLDVDFSIIYAKEAQKIAPEILIGYRYRQRTYRRLDLLESDYGDPGDEFHYRIGVNFVRDKNTKKGFSLSGYFSQDKIEYFYNNLWGEQALVYRKPYKLSFEFTISHFFKGKTIFGKNAWFNITILKTVSWRNELGGWGLVLSF